MLTHRQKSILVGSRCAGILGGQLVDKSFSHPHYTLWRSNQLKGIEANDPFFNILQEKFQESGGSIRIPVDYLEKLSPLAVAVWMIEGGHEFGQLYSYNDKQNYDIIKIFKQRFGINLKVSADELYLLSATADDQINLWLLTKDHIIEACPSFIPGFEAQYVRKHKQIYLSGSQQYSKDFGCLWRAKVSPILFKSGFTIYSPPIYDNAANDIYGVNFQQLKENDFTSYMKIGEFFRKKDLPAVLASDSVLLYWDDGVIRGSGTKSELTYCADYNVPVYVALADGFTKHDLPLWSLGCIKSESYIFSSLDSAIDEILKTRN